jgi:hypothetical protein
MTSQRRPTVPKASGDSIEPLTTRSRPDNTRHHVLGTPTDISTGTASAQPLHRIIFSSHIANVVLQTSHLPRRGATTPQTQGWSSSTEMSIITNRLCHLDSAPKNSHLRNDPILHTRQARPLAGKPRRADAAEVSRSAFCCNGLGECGPQLNEVIGRPVVVPRLYLLSVSCNGSFSGL